jgi:hypothetical protein
MAGPGCGIDPRIAPSGELLGSFPGLAGYDRHLVPAGRGLAGAGSPARGEMEIVLRENRLEGDAR